MSFLNAVEKRRTYYNLDAESPVSDEELQKIVEHGIRHAPSAFNSQSGRVVLLKGEEHKALWEITMECLRKVVPPEAFHSTEKKINSFAAAYGTLLFFEEQDTVRSLQESFPLYSDKFPGWSEEHSAILQFVIWTALEEAGLGANLQHYDPLIDDKVKERWSLPQSWKLIAEMPFGKIVSPPEEKSFLPVKERFRAFG